jgi:lipopolysaccharide transport system ATP-binding protein
MSYVLKVDNVSKSFIQYHSEFHRILSWFGIYKKPKQTTQILNSINFTIKDKEAIGIVGQNGAGKSTLLKIITSTLKPTSGQIIVQGRISAILELGMGFHPDMTGRENVYNSAGLMGFSKHQIDKVIKDIEDFAEIGEYFDKPVRTYSSGMQVRVAFSVATAYRPEILIIDEALSVGDTYFQHKSFAKIKEFQSQGTTLLIVSHDRNAIQALCNRAILLENGHIIKDGNPEEVMDFYNALIAQKEDSKIQQQTTKEGKIQTISGNQKVSLIDISLLDRDDKPTENINIAQSVTLRVKIKALYDIPQVVLGYVIKDRLGQDIFGTNSYYHNQILTDIKKDQEIEYNFCFDANLGVGSYSISIAAHQLENHIHENYLWVDRALTFQVINMDKKDFVGVAWIEPKLTISNSE